MIRHDKIHVVVNQNMMNGKNDGRIRSMYDWIY